MTHRAHAVPRTTRTLNQAQLDDVNAALRAAPVPAAAIGLEASDGVVERVVVEGSPIFGYFYARLRGLQDRVLLHTDHLRAISRTLHLPHHHWGL